MGRSNETSPEEPKQYNIGYLQEQWIKINDGVTLPYFAELKMKYMALEKSNYMWLFQYNRESLQESLEEDIFVPGFFVLQSKTDDNLYTACVWPEHIPIVLPPVDYVIVMKKYKKLFRTHEESGLVPYQKIMDQFGKLFTPFEHPVPNLKIIRQTDSDKIEKEFNGMKLGEDVEKYGRMVGMSVFVNVRP